MDKETYIRYRTSGNWPVTILYEYYKEKCTKNCLDELSFNKIIVKPIVNSNMELVMFNRMLAIERIVLDWDRKFNVITLKDKMGNIIKIC